MLPPGHARPAHPAPAPVRLLDQWGSIDQSQPIVIPPIICSFFPAAYCPVVVGYGQTSLKTSAASAGCELARWIVPGDCILPPPHPVLQPLLSRWERRSQPLVVGTDAKAAMRAFLPYMQAAEAATGDESLGQEIQLLNQLVA